TNIVAKDVELGPVLVDFWCQPYAVTGPMDWSGDARLQLSDPWRTVNGSGRIRVGRGKVMGREVVTLIREVLTLAGAGGGGGHRGAAWPSTGAARLRVDHRQLHDRERRRPDEGPPVPGARRPGAGGRHGHAVRRSSRHEADAHARAEPGGRAHLGHRRRI